MTSGGHNTDARKRTARRVGWALLFIALAVAANVALQWDVVWGLVPGRVGAPDTTIHLADSEGEPEVRLAVMGDVGTGDANEWATAGLVTRAGFSRPFDALILLGDNVYPNGDPDGLSGTVFDPFATVLGQGTSLLPVLGNHDVRDGHAAAQIAALGMPGRWYATEIGPLLFIGLDSSLVDDRNQRLWLDATLSGSEAQWVIVAMHHPAFSAGFHGSSDIIQETWVPMFRRYGVDLVLAGHDHDYQRTESIDGVTYIVSGAGAKLRPTARADFTAFSASVLHFLDIAIWDDRLEVTAIGGDGAFDHVIIDTSATTAGGPIALTGMQPVQNDKNEP